MQAERERQFEMELRRVKGLEVRHMLEDGNCLFRAVTHLVYGDAEMYDETRQMCIDYMVSTVSDYCYLYPKLLGRVAKLLYEKLNLHVKFITCSIFSRMRLTGF